MVEVSVQNRAPGPCRGEPYEDKVLAAIFTFMSPVICYQLRFGGRLVNEQFCFQNTKTKREFNTYGKAFVHIVLGALTLSLFIFKNHCIQILMHCFKNSFKNY